MFRLLLSLLLVLFATAGPGKPGNQEPPAPLDAESCCGPRPCPPPGCLHRIKAISETNWRRPVVS